MPVALFTYHAYGSWLTDRKRGYVRRGQGFQSTNVRLAQVQRGLMKHAEEHFDVALQKSLIERFIQVCEEAVYRAHGAASETSHLHLLTSWQDHAIRLKQVGGKIKNLLSLHLSNTTGEYGHKWFARRASRQRVNGRKHFDYLLNVYLPGHHGVFWSERTGWREPLA